MTVDDAARRMAMLAPSEVADATVPPRFLELYGVNTRERLRVELFRPDGRMNEAAVPELMHALRDHRTEEERSPNLRLLVILYAIGQHYGRPLQLVSGYRHPKRARQQTSRHASAHAADITVEGVDPAELAEWVRGTFESVGVGYYPVSGFVHVDVRDSSYYWLDRSGPGEPQRNQAVPLEPMPPAGSDWTVGFSER